MDNLHVSPAETRRVAAMQKAKDFLNAKRPNNAYPDFEHQLGQLDLHIEELTDTIRNLNVQLFDAEAPDYLIPSMLDMYDPDNEPKGRSAAKLIEVIGHLRTLFSHMNAPNRRINDLLDEYERELLSLKAKQGVVSAEWEWRILDFDEAQNRALAITTQNVVFMRYHRYDDNGTYREIWEKCDLRAWLNDDFYRLLPDSVRSRVLEVENKNVNVWLGTDEGNDTRDQIFLLSADEAQAYFENDLDRRSSDEWWLRTMGLYGPCHVDEDGAINGYGEDAVSDTMTWMWFGAPNIRPAMWIGLDGLLGENENLKQNVLRMKVVGLGGAGAHLVYDLYSRWQDVGVYKEIDFIAMDTDMLSLKTNRCTNKVLLELGGIYERSSGLGEFAVEQNMAGVVEALHDAKLLIIVAGMGGNTATSAAPRIAAIAKEMGCFVVAMAITPFDFEGKHRAERAQAGVEKLLEVCDGVIVFPNDYLLKIAAKGISADGDRSLSSINHSIEMASDWIYEEVRKVAGIVFEADAVTKRVFDLAYNEVYQELDHVMEIVNEPDNAKALYGGGLSFDIIRQRLMDWWRDR